MVQKSFRKTGISNNLDGTEDDLICEDEESGGIIDEIQVVENEFLKKPLFTHMMTSWMTLQLIFFSKKFQSQRK